MVFNTVSLAVQSVLRGDLPAGVAPAQEKIEIVNNCLEAFCQLGEVIPRTNKDRLREELYKQQRVIE